MIRPYTNPEEKYFFNIWFCILNSRLLHISIYTLHIYNTNVGLQVWNVNINEQTFFIRNFSLNYNQHSWYKIRYSIRIFTWFKRNSNYPNIYTRIKLSIYDLRIYQYFACLLLIFMNQTRVCLYFWPYPKLRDTT